MTTTFEQAAVAAVTVCLQRRHPDLDATVLEEIAVRHFAAFDGSPKRDYLPLFVERRALDELRQPTVIGG